MRTYLRNRFRPARPAVPGAVLLAVALFWISLYLYVPFLAPQAARLGAGVGAVGLVLGSYGLVQLCSRLPLGLWSDRARDRGLFLVGAGVIAAAAAAGMGLGRSALALEAFRGLSAVATSAWVPITLWVADMLPQDQLAATLGLVYAAANGGQVVAQLLGGVLAVGGGYRRPFLAAVPLGLAAAVLAFTLRHRPAAAPAPAAPAERGWARSLRFALPAALLQLLAQFVAYVTLYGFLPLTAERRFGTGGFALGLLSFCALLPGAFMPLLARRLDQGRWRQRAVQLCFCGAAVGTALLPLAPDVLLLGLAAALVGACLTLLPPLLTNASVARVPRAHWGAAMGLFQSVYAVGTFAGPTFAGALGARFGAPGLFGSAALAGAIGALLAPRLLVTR